MINQILIFVFAFLGGIIRYFISLNFSWGLFPIATLFVNLVGAAFLPYWNERLSSKNKYFRFTKEAVGVGFCGSLTTFSTMVLDVFRLIQTNHTNVALAYLLLTMFGGVIVSAVSASLIKEVTQ